MRIRRRRVGRPHERMLLTCGHQFRERQPGHHRLRPRVHLRKNIRASDEQLYRALAFSNLIAIYQKQQLGKLSAYCGAVSAATGAGAAITFLSGGSIQQISDTITNTIANISGIVCDGAKSSCAAKIATSLHAAITAHYMAMDNQVFQPGEGLVRETLAETVSAYTTMGRVGMKDTDIAILNMMIS